MRKNKRNINKKKMQEKNERGTPIQTLTTHETVLPRGLGE